MRLSEALSNTDTITVSPNKGIRLSEALNTDSHEFELRALSQETLSNSRGMTDEEKDIYRKKKEVDLVKEYPKDFYSGSTAQIESFMKGVLPLRYKEFERPGVEEAHPIANAVGRVTGLIATGALTQGIAPFITYSKPIAALPTVARFAAGRMAQSGATFGLKEIADNMAEVLSGDKKEFNTVVTDTLTATGFGIGLGAVGSIASPVARIPSQAAYGFVTAKMGGSDNFEAGINAGIFAVFGLFNTRNLSETYKKAALSGAKKAMVDRMIAKGYTPDRAEIVSERYFKWAIEKNGGWAKQKIKDFDTFSKAMRKGWKVIVEPELKPTEPGLVKVTPEGKAIVPKEAISLLKQPITEEIVPEPTPSKEREIESTKEMLEKTPELKPVTTKDIGPPPEKPPEFPGVSKEFLKQPKPKTTILQYFTPAEYHLKQLGFDAKIGQPIREALQNFSIELMQKNDLLVGIQKEHYAEIPKKQRKISNEKLWQYMDKGIPEKELDTVEGRIAQKLRPETEEMLERINKLNVRIGREEVKGIKNYILHMLSPEILNEIYSKGVIPPELAKVMEYIPPKNVFLRTAIERKGVPEEWLVKNPYELMKAMYAIDLRYIYLQDALEDVSPYLKAVKEYHPKKGEYWSPETYKYLDEWIKQAIKMRPSNWDTLIDNMLEYTFAPLLRKAGMKVSHMPWRDLIGFLSASAHTGALGMRIKPILRNLIQSTFDWVMYGTEPYLKGSAKFLTPSGHAILKQSKVWKTRIPYEAQDLATLRKIFKIGGFGYRISDLHNVGKGLLTRYYHAIDDLKMTHEEALKWADNDLPATQWSYRREDLPRAYWTTTGRAFWTLGSWWMNFYNRFLPELSRRAFTGKDVTGRIVPPSERLGIMRLLILVGTLFAVKQASKEITGTAIDYTGQVKPTPLREAPIAQLGKSFIKISQGIIDEDNRKIQEGLRELSNTGAIFIPWYLASKDLFDLLNGKKKLEEVLFYTERQRSRKVR